MSQQPEFVATPHRPRGDNDACIVSCGIGPEYQEGLHSTRLHCEVNVPEAWRLFYRELPLGCPSHEAQQYAFKIYAIQRAVDAGFRYILWMDASFQPIRSIEPLWAVIREQGWYAPRQGDAMLGTWASDAFLEALQLSRDTAMTIPMCLSGLVGFDMRSDAGRWLWHQWREEYRLGMWNGPHLNKPGQPTEVWGQKFSGHCSYDPRCEGHRHDETSLSWLLHLYGVQPQSRGFLTIEDPNGFIGHHVRLVVPDAR